jgi:pimeloyl-ACP methyl ester carboxylesterase
MFWIKEGIAMSYKHSTSLGLAVLTGLLVLSSFSAAIVVADNDHTPRLVMVSAPSVNHADVNGVSLGYREYGSGEPLLLICGFGATMSQWNATFVSLLAVNNHVFVYDHRGMGFSGDDNSTHTMEMYADDAVGLMHTLGYQSMNIYGTSMGSSISQQIMIDHPEAVRKAVLSSATYSVRIPECALLLATIESVVSNTSYSLGVREEAQANLAWGGAWSGLAGIDKPVMLIVGTSDVLTPDPVSVQISGQINASCLVRLVGIQHSGQSYAPVQYAGSVNFFLMTNEAPHFAPIVPLAPTNLTAIAGDKQVSLSWNASVSNGGSGITEYTVYRGSAPVAHLNATTLSYVDAGLTGGTVYTYYVVAVNSVGPSAISLPVSSQPTGQGSIDLVLVVGIIAALVIIIVVAILIARSRK